MGTAEPDLSLPFFPTVYATSCQGAVTDEAREGGKARRTSPIQSLMITDLAEPAPATTG